MRVFLLTVLLAAGRSFSATPHEQIADITGVTVSGPSSPADSAPFRKAMTSHLAQVSSCLKSGKAALFLVTHGDGSIVGAGADEVSGANHNAGYCIALLARDWEFPDLKEARAA